MIGWFCPSCACDCPTTPVFASLIEAILEHTGWVFVPPPKRQDGNCLTVAQVGRSISQIGKKANVVANASSKFASAHDLQRSFWATLADAGLPPRDLQSIMRDRRS